MWLEWLDDKKMVILAVVGLTAWAMYVNPAMVTENFNAVLTGLYGLAVGVAAGATLKK